jgi:hypothetical protein
MPKTDSVAAVASQPNTPSSVMWWCICHNWELWHMHHAWWIFANFSTWSICYCITFVCECLCFLMLAEVVYFDETTLGTGWNIVFDKNVSFHLSVMHIVCSLEQNHKFFHWSEFFQ